MGVVYKAEDTKLNRDVAIKFLPQQIAASEEERERIKIAAQAPTRKLLIGLADIAVIALLASLGTFIFRPSETTSDTTQKSIVL